ALFRSSGRSSSSTHPRVHQRRTHSDFCSALPSRFFDDPTLQEIAGRHGKSAAQVMLRWHLQEGSSAIPKSTKPARIAENFDVCDFELSGAEMAAIDALDTGVRGGPEPDSITLENSGMAIPEA
ncbi:MAG: aldo/keto reductase, partial [Actinomycetota bacterium]|nr:aldo/keto reductase [Actinomycetota bacterium]